jgi:hypothetical protein
MERKPMKNKRYDSTIKLKERKKQGEKIKELKREHIKWVNKEYIKIEKIFNWIKNNEY